MNNRARKNRADGYVTHPSRINSLACPAVTFRVKKQKKITIRILQSDNITIHLIVYFCRPAIFYLFFECSFIRKSMTKKV